MRGGQETEGERRRGVGRRGEKDERREGMKEEEEREWKRREIE